MIKQTKVNKAGNITLKKHIKTLGLKPYEKVGILVSSINGEKSIIISKSLLNFTDDNKIIEVFSKNFLKNNEEICSFIKNEVLNPEKLRAFFFEK